MQKFLTNKKRVSNSKNPTQTMNAGILLIMLCKAMPMLDKSRKSHTKHLYLSLPR